MHIVDSSSSGSIAAALVTRFERADTKSASVLKRAAYAVMNEFGIDVGSLAEEAIQQELKNRKAALARAERRETLIRAKLANGQLSPEDRKKAEKALAKAPDNVKAQRAAIKKLLDRPQAWPTAPTAERTRQAASAPIVEPVEGGLRRYRYDWAVDQAKGLLTDAEYAAAVRLRNAYYEKQPRSAISSYGDAGGGSDPSRRLPMAERQEAAGRDFNGCFMTLPGETKRILEWFVLEDPPAGATRAPTLEEFGREFGRTKDSRRAKGFADGYLKSALSVLAHHVQKYDQWKADVARQSRRSQPQLRCV